VLPKSFNHLTIIFTKQENQYGITVIPPNLVQILHRWSWQTMWSGYI